MGTKLVITYQHAHEAGTSTLCSVHADKPPSWIPALGPVSHGLHAGRCRACITRDQIQALREESIDAGDAAQVRVCDEALAGSVPARQQCARAIDAR